MIIGTVKIKMEGRYWEPAPARDRRARVWFGELERMRAHLGVRAQTAHIGPRGWARHFESGNLPGDALLSALTRSAD